jgi:hypothetical protein
MLYQALPCLDRKINEHVIEHLMDGDKNCTNVQCDVRFREEDNSPGHKHINL